MVICQGEIWWAELPARAGSDPGFRRPVQAVFGRVVGKWMKEGHVAKTKEHAHELIDRLAPGQVAAVVGLLEIMLDPVSRSLANAPLDDHPVSEEERREIAAVRTSLDRGEGIPHEQVLAEFGLSSDDFDRMGRTPLDSHNTNR
jgi:hypothetical protein